MLAVVILVGWLSDLLWAFGKQSDYFGGERHESQQNTNLKVTTFR